MYLLLSGIVNAVLNLILVIPFKMGVAGVGIAIETFSLQSEEDLSRHDCSAIRGDTGMCQISLIKPFDQILFHQK